MVRNRTRALSSSFSRWAAITFHHFNYYGSGEFDITVNEKGEITDAKVIGSLRGSQQFKQEVFNYLRSVVLQKKDNEAQLKGKFNIVILQKFPAKDTEDFE